MRESSSIAMTASLEHPVPGPEFTDVDQALSRQQIEVAIDLVDSYAHGSDVRGITQQGGRAVLHVGCGDYHPTKLPPMFRQKAWREIRLDIDPDVRPDFVESITDMRSISDCMVDAVYSSHNIEHLYPHEVTLALQEMHRVLKPEGIIFIVAPDVQEVARHVAEGKLEDMLYLSTMGPIAALDVLYGHRGSLARGHAFMAHHTGFTGGTLAAALVGAGFAAVLLQRNPTAFSLTAVAFRSEPGRDEIAAAQAQFVPDLPCVLYTPLP
jgi:SAM-dependent methyltransferase